MGGHNSGGIAGNPPEKRVERLREFWETVSNSPVGIPYFPELKLENEFAHSIVNQLRSWNTLLFGAPSFFKLRLPPPYLYPSLSPRTLSYYDTTPLKATLERLVDFDLINAGATRFSVGTVNVRSGNFVYFDNATDQIGPQPVMASGSLPPGFSGHGNRGRILLGRRPRLQHAVAMGARLQPTARHTRFSARFVERARRTTARPDRG